MYGNFCGPYWSDGKVQSSVIGEKNATDEFDETCKLHDEVYARKGNLKKADMDFYAANIGKGILRSGAAVAVGLQGSFRSVSAQTKMTKKLRGSKQQQPRTNGGNTTANGNDVVRYAPVSISTRRSGKAAKIVTAKDTITVSHRSLIGSIAESTSYDANKLACNPGVPQSFPWLSDMANRYDMYRFKRLRYEYRSVCSTSEPGVTMLSFDYDAADSLPTSKTQQAQTIPNAENNVWMNNDLVVKCDNIKRYTRQAVVSGTDIKTYDLGNLVYSTIYGAGSDTTVGELYVDYEVEFSKPSLSSALTQHVFFTGDLAVPLTATTYNVGVEVIEQTSASSFKFTVGGEYLMLLEAIGTGLSAISSPTAIDQGTVSAVTSSFFVGSTQACRTYRFQVSAGDQFTVAGLVVGTTQDSTELTITKCDFATVAATS